MALAATASLPFSARLAAQEAAAAPEPVRGEVFVGSEAERYLRVLQLAGHAPVYPWSIRGLGARDLDRAAPADSAGHPWAAAMDFRRRPGARVSLVGPTVAGRFNSAFPYGGNDGPVWAGTASGAGGVPRPVMRAASDFTPR